MSYTPGPEEEKLALAVNWLKQQPTVHGRCLGYVRQALGLHGLRLPPPQVPHSTALLCGKVLGEDPAKWGWAKCASPGVHPYVLCFFSRCGFEGSLECGHIAIFERSSGTLFSCDDYHFNQSYWGPRLMGQYVPLEHTS